MNKDKRTKQDLLRARWTAINSRHLYRGYENVKVLISKNRFFEVFDNEDFEKLFNSWVDGGRKLSLAPSIDRIDPTGHYEESNMRWITFSENASRARNKGVHRRRPVMQFSKDGNYIRTFTSISDAGRAVNGSSRNIVSVARGRISSSAGFIWKYADVSK